MEKLKVAFICVHNSCRSQMAEIISQIYVSDVFEAYSAGTHLKDKINQDAVKVIKELYGLDMEVTQRPKLIAALPRVDIVITMGCEVECPYLPALYREDWELKDPTGQPLEFFVETAKTIENKVLDLANRIKNGLVPLRKNNFKL